MTRSYYVIIALLATASTALAAPRPEAHAIRVPDGSITIDGSDRDWRMQGAQLDGNRAAANDAAHLTFTMPDRGNFGGPDDIGVTCWLANDSANFYLLANVRDQLLFNDAKPASCYEGDDFEVFIDANPAEVRFGDKKNENVKQLIFVPGGVNSAMPKAFVWMADQNKGVEAASKLRPWGYSLELKIPKALFPNWAAHPDLESIGFDITVVDADAPGVDLYHSAFKQALGLLQPTAHFMSPKELGLLKLDKDLPAMRMIITDQQPMPLTTDQLIAAMGAAQPMDPARLAQLTLDAIGTPDATRVATAAVGSPSPLIRKAGLLVFAKHPELAAPIAEIRRQVGVRGDAYANIDGLDCRSYGLVALAVRGQLPVAELNSLYPRLPDNALRLTYIWCLGRNGDRAATPMLTHFLFDSNIRMRMMGAMGLAMLRDPAALPALREMAANDPHHYGRAQAEATIKELTIDH